MIVVKGLKYERTEDGRWGLLVDGVVRLIVPDDRFTPSDLTDALDVIERLSAIVDRLPKTVDGVPMVCGDEVFGGWEGTGIVWSIDRANGAYIKQPGGVFWRDGRECYSSREAAEKARKS